MKSKNSKLLILVTILLIIIAGFLYLDTRVKRATKCTSQVNESRCNLINKIF